ncbi:mucus-binding protein [Secundilactobacillus pentosiphilus]|uniref:Mucus-binding protein n=1 Tax=Secundilactobacillus pentosiphilus TaxID=1714682 RepID=A0A1Z5IXQ9_9LACO|nr:KxYKxGKxW signal peptide domain-containing protein [Secundilactobacillus pentosiphilus]GAX06517.1 mucus-binding protein [Secundilactobacillus pentosiphilus]
MSKNNLKSPYIESKHRVKLYKRGKQWVAMGITLAALTGVSFVASDTASAAETVTPDSTATVGQTAPANDTNSSAAITTPDAANTPSGTTAAVAPDSTTGTAANTDKPSTGTPAAATASQNQPTATVRSADNTGNQDVVSARAVSAPTPAPAPTQAVGPTVTTTDKSGAASTDPANTGNSNDSPTVVTGEKVASDFVAGGSNGTTLPKITSDTVDLTNPAVSGHTQNGVVVAKDAIDFNSDFSLNATVNVNWDSATMGGWLGGDGMAVAFQPVSLDTAMTKAGFGSGMGLVRGIDGTISYIISTDAIRQSPKQSDGQPFTQLPNWVIYQSADDSSQAIGGVFDTGIALPASGSTGSLKYTFDVTYKAATKQLVTNILDSNDQIVKTYTQTITDEQIGKNYLLGVTAATASSKAAYSVTINKYTYVPADAKLNITSNMPNVAQSNINGTPGQVIAFYQEGTAKPTADSKGNAVSVAYTVPKVDGYTLSPQFVTLTAGGENTVAINYVGKQINNAIVTIPTNKGEQTVTNVSGQVGNTVQISVPAISGYTPDKTKVTATVNADGTITVNGPKAQSGDAGYVTYTGDPQTLTVKLGNTGKVWTTTGASDTPINYDQQAIVALIPKGYTINSNTSKKIFDSLLQQLNAPTAFDHDSTKDQTITLPLQAAEDFSHTTTTRTIHFVDSTGKTVSPDVVQTVNWVRGSDATTDPTTGAFQPMDWYASVTAPTIAGYTPDIKTIAEVYPMMVTTPGNAEDITVTYTADTQTMVVHVGDKTWTTMGPSGSAINYDAGAILSLIPKGYTVTYNQQTTTIEALLTKAPANFDTDTANDQAWTLPISPAENFNHTTTTRTIHFVDNTGKTVSPDIVQTVNWVKVSDANAASTAGAYTPVDWYTSVTAPTITGYKPDIATIAEDYPMITDQPENAKDITVTYTGETQKLIVTVGDKTWTTTGESGSDIHYDTQAILALIPDGYSISANTSGTTLADWLANAPKQFDTDTAKDQTLTLPISPAESFNHTTTTRTIHFVDGNGKALTPDVVQTVNWVQTVDAATGKPTDVYTPMDWYTEISTPTVAGYTTATAKVAADYPLITDAPTNAKDITIVYTGNQITTDVTIPSNQGDQTVAHVTGNVGDVVNVAVPTLDGYTADKTTVSATVNPDGTITVNGPKAKPGDAGYVTYTAISTNVPDQGDNNGLPGNNLTDVDTPTTNDTPQPDTIPNPVTTPTDDADKDTVTRQNSTAVKSDQNGTRSGHSNTVTAIQNGGAVLSTSAAAGHATAAQPSSSATAAGQTTTGQQTKQAAAGQLPQTNEQSDQVKTTGVLGLILLSLLSLFGLRRKETGDK